MEDAGGEVSEVLGLARLAPLVIVYHPHQAGELTWRLQEQNKNNATFTCARWWGEGVPEWIRVMRKERGL